MRSLALLLLVSRAHAVGRRLDAVVCDDYSSCTDNGGYNCDVNRPQDGTVHSGYCSDCDCCIFGGCSSGCSCAGSDPTPDPTAYPTAAAPTTESPTAAAPTTDAPTTAAPTCPPPSPCDCIATPPSCNDGPFVASCANIGYDPSFEFDIAGNTWTGLGVHEPFDGNQAGHDHYEYQGNFSTTIYSTQWSYVNTNKGWLPWCYTCCAATRTRSHATFHPPSTLHPIAPRLLSLRGCARRRLRYGKCVGDYGISFTVSDNDAPQDECGYWQYLTGADRSMNLGGAGTTSHGAYLPGHGGDEDMLYDHVHPAVPGHYPIPQGADCLEKEPLPWNSNVSDASAASDPTPVDNRCRCLAPDELSAACLAVGSLSGTPGLPHDPRWNSGDCVSEDGENGSETAVCRDGGTDCATGSACADDNDYTKIHYSDTCYPILFGNLFSGDAVRTHGQHAVANAAADWSWCFTAGECADDLGSPNALGNPSLYDADGCQAWWAYLDRRYYGRRGALCYPGQEGGPSSDGSEPGCASPIVAAPTTPAPTTAAPTAGVHPAPSRAPPRATPLPTPLLSHARPTTRPRTHWLRCSRTHQRRAHDRGAHRRRAHERRAHDVHPTDRLRVLG
jgi:hypothetical protein